MKQLLFVAGLALLISCNDGTTGAGTNEDNAQRNGENSREVYRAIETGDVSKLDSFIAEDIIDHNGNPDGSDIRGRDSVKALLSRIRTYFDGLKIEHISDATSADGNYHFALIRMRGKAKQNPWGMPVGQDIDDTSVDVVKIRDGMATEHWGFMSMGDMQEMMAGMHGGGGGGQKPPAAADTTQR
ncbi:MAG: nuclear transport factor 2 family protein [Chitinophagaceae bacterium]